MSKNNVNHMHNPKQIRQNSQEQLSIKQ